MKKAAIVLAVVGLSAPAQAQEWKTGEGWTAGWMTRVCSSEDMTDQLICNSYLRGFQAGEYAEVYEIDPEAMRLRAHCTPKEVTFQQMAAVVAKLGNEHPELWHTPAAILVVNALKRAWPCPK